MQALQQRVEELEARRKASTTPLTLVSPSYRPIPPMARVHASTARFVAACCGVRSGKTHGAAREFLLRIQRDRAAKKGGLHYWAVAPTYPLTRIQEEELRDELRSAGALFQWRATERMMLFAAGITIQFKSADNPEHLVGVGLDGLWIDEVARVKPEAWRGQLRMRLSDRTGWALFSTTPLGRNWFHAEIWERGCDGSEIRDPAYASFTWRTVDNTAIPSLVAEVEQARIDLPLAYFRREYEASFDAFVGQVFSEWEPTLHVIGVSNRLGLKTLPQPLDAQGNPTPWPDVRYGFDPAYGHDGALLACVRDVAGVWYVAEEKVAPSILPNDWADMATEMVKKWGDGIIFFDPSRPEYRKLFSDRGLKARPANNEVLTTIQSIAILLHPINGKPRLFIDAAKAPKTAMQIPGYRWQSGIERPVKENDDTVDALRYALCSQIPRTSAVK